MESIGILLSPLLLLPGAALLIFSTSIRLNNTHDEVHHQTEQQNSPPKEIIDHLLMRARYFRNALVFLYSSISIFAVAGIAIGIGIGTALGVAINDIGAGIGMGVAIGVAIGTMMNIKINKKKDDK